MAQREVVFPPIGTLSTKPMAIRPVRSKDLLFVSDQREEPYG